MPCYAIQPKNRIFVNGYGFLYFAKNTSKNTAKNVSGKYNHKLLDHTKSEIKLLHKE